jgi:hypothetical protein
MLSQDSESKLKLRHYPKPVHLRRLSPRFNPLPGRRDDSLLDKLSPEVSFIQVDRVREWNISH